jgi:phosphoribosylanthranilate isomerase
MGTPVRVKICGLTSVEDALLAADAGADAIGLVFWERSPRAVSLDTARRIADALPPFVTRVGVFVNASREEMTCVADATGLDVLQLHGDEPVDDVRGLRRRAVKALRVDGAFSLDFVSPFVAAGCGVLLDSGSAAQPGGTGNVLDWTLARAVRERVPQLILAGGLTPENVGDAIRTVAPWAVDVSSGVERSPGRKDANKMHAFVEAVRRAL